MDCDFAPGTVAPDVSFYADGIGPWKLYIVPAKISPWKDSKADGTPYKGSMPETSTQEATSVVADAHKIGLFVHVFTFRNEKKYLAADYRREPSLEYLKFFRLGVDGVFTDFTHTGANNLQQSWRFDGEPPKAV